MLLLVLKWIWSCEYGLFDLAMTYARASCWKPCSSAPDRLRVTR